MFLVLVFEEKMNSRIKIVFYKPHEARKTRLINLHIFFRLLSHYSAKLIDPSCNGCMCLQSLGLQDPKSDLKLWITSFYNLKRAGCHQNLCFLNKCFFFILFMSQMLNYASRKIPPVLFIILVLLLFML